MKPSVPTLFWLKPALKNVHPDRPSSWAQAHEILQERLHAFQEHLPLSPAPADSPDPRADGLRETLLNVEELEDLVAWRVYLEWELAQGLCTLGPDQEGAVAQLPRPQNAWRLLRDLALSPEAPQKEVLLQARLDATFLPLKVLVDALPPQRRTIRQILRPLRRLEEQPEAFVKGLVSLVRGGVVKRRISSALLREVPDPLHSLLLIQKHRTHLLAPPLLEQLEAAPHQFPRTPEWKALKENRARALAELEQGTLTAQAWTQWMKHEEDFQAHLPVILQKLLNLRPPFHLTIHPKVCRALERWQTELPIWALLFLDAPRANRLMWLQAFPRTADPRQLPQVVLKELQKPLESQASSLDATPSEPRLVQELTKVHRWVQGLQQAGLLHLVLSPEWLRKALSLPRLFSAGLRYLEPRTLVSLPEVPRDQREEFLLWTLRGRPEEEPLLQGVLQEITPARVREWLEPWRRHRQKSTLARVREWLEPWRRRRLQRGGPEHVRLLVQMWQVVRQEKGPSSKSWQEDLSAMSPQELRAVKDQLGASALKPREWRHLVQQPWFWKEPSLQDDLRHFPFRSWKARGQELPAPMRALAEQDSTFLDWVVTRAPEAFQDLFLQQHPWWELLPMVIHRALVARAFSSHVQPEQIPQALEFLQAHYGPNQRAALELALHFGLHHAPFLLGVASGLSLGREEDLKGNECDAWYQTHELPKRSGGVRVITAPQAPLKHFQRAVLDRELNQWDLHEAATGFRKGMGIVENAQRHCGHRLVVNVDIQGFFPNTRLVQVLRVLTQRLRGRFQPRAIRLLAVLLSYNGALPTGAPTSPALANQILRPVDAALATVAHRQGVAYTRYADDLTFSANHSGAMKLLPFVEEVLAGQGYVLDPKKTNFFRKGRRQSVTGLVVNEKPNWPKPLRRRLRAAVHRRVQTEEAALWHGRPVRDDQLLGLVDFLAQTQPEEAAALRAQLQTRGVGK